MVDVREATAADAAALAELRWEFRAGRAAPVESREAFIARCSQWMARELASGAWRAWVAVADGRIVGQVWVDLLEKVPNPVGERERHAYVSNLYVRPDQRGGVGTRLLGATITWAKQSAVDRIVLWPTTRSVSLYTRAGFTRDGDVMELTCTPPEGQINPEPSPTLRSSGTHRR
jgi:GNAT superfamily N-acetyltransferase